jgi:hypothetical protein
MSNSMNDRVAADFQALKAEGKQRATKIGEVLRPAVSETVNEVKAGSATMWTIAKSLVVAVVAMVRETVIPEQSAKLSEKFAAVDGQLNEKYGDRYQSIKQRLVDLKAQYDNRTKPES